MCSSTLSQPKVKIGQIAPVSDCPVHSYKPSQLLLPLLFCPPVSWWALASQYADRTLIEVHENWQAQTLRNRCYILQSQGVQSLTIAVRNQHAPYIAVYPDSQSDWIALLYRSICAAYGKAPFFEYYIDRVVPSTWLDKKSAAYSQWSQASMQAINWHFVQSISKIVRLGITFEPSAQWEKTPSDTLDMRQAYYKRTIRPEKLSSPWKEHCQNWHQAPYHQTFGVRFEEDLSVLDLVFNLGPETKNYLTQSGARYFLPIEV